MICPKCGFEQPGGDECARCGVVFRKALAPPAGSGADAAAATRPVPAVPAAEPPAPPPARRFPLIPILLVVLLGLVAQARFGIFVEPSPAVAVRHRGRPAAAEPHGVPPAPAAPVAAEPGPPGPEPTFPVYTRPVVPPPPTPQAAPPAFPTPEPRREREAVAVGGWYEGAEGFAQAEADRQRHRTPMAVYFHTDWCGWCRKMESDYLQNGEAGGYLDTLVKVRINPERGAAEAALARRFGVRGYPSFFIVPASGGGGRRVHPFRREGAMTAAEFVEECRRAE